jgi:glucose-1-phosphate thymidylyltransferase
VGAAKSGTSAPVDFLGQHHDVFYDHDLTAMLVNAVSSAKQDSNATDFGYHVQDPERYGVAEFDKDGNVISLEGKLKEPKSSYAVTGLYFYPNDIIKRRKRPNRHNVAN